MRCHRYPRVGAQNNLDALCRRYGIDNSQREKHGALLDAEILADVYLTMTGGQASLSLGASEGPAARAEVTPQRLDANRPPLKVLRADAEELAAHTERLAAIDKASDGRCIWSKFDS